jgi:hypothetical protein
MNATVAVRLGMLSLCESAVKACSLAEDAAQALSNRHQALLHHQCRMHAVHALDNNYSRRRGHLQCFALGALPCCSQTPRACHLLSMLAPQKQLLPSRTLSAAENCRLRCGSIH